ncbi:hypothetical protein EEB15_08010 [Ramlibacter sp. WS9]|nr:hypothetical protein EEB15_08010 [Ramlibacter sp. WS9]
MNRSLSQTPIKLLRYTPRSGGKCRIFGAVWKRKDGVHWASPIVNRTGFGFDPQPFMSRFPDAAFEVEHFEAAVAWLDSVCFAAREPIEVARACATEVDLGLSCVPYGGPQRDGDLASLLSADPAHGAWDDDLMRSSVIVSLTHLVKDHPVLRGLPLDVARDGAQECAWLHLADERVVRIKVDSQTESAHVIDVLLAEHDRLATSGQGNEHTFIVFPRLRSALPVTLTQRVTGSGIKYPHIANGLVRLVWGVGRDPASD